MAAITAVEHVVLFKVRDGTDTAKISAMISNLRSLVSLDGVLLLSAAHVLRHRSSAASSFGFTHLLHSRYRTKEELAAYSAHPAHISVVREFVLPICEDIMALDWIAEFESDSVALPPGSAARVTLMKLIESAGEAEKGVVLESLHGAKRLLGGAVEQLSYGENFSPARAKGFSVGSIAVFPGVEELDEVDEKGVDLMEAQKEKVRPLLESLIVLDFLVPPPLPATSGL
ncbi:unnamed protein product [Spirodela intermedia]|uniref:Stress-response A/B barrel domain-containing protein n=1 Tax=Spirodela intermedia TaxID=51605 RepID=A0A7I8IQB6_SPIIN|nr:unnamed protein product [Spirodela intermedia]CAA6659331.1 unnamed protein product [Spirodela intermedia]